MIVQGRFLRQNYRTIIVLSYIWQHWSMATSTDIEEEIMDAYIVSIAGLKDNDLFLQRYVRAGVATMSEESMVALRK